MLKSTHTYQHFACLKYLKDLFVRNVKHHTKGGGNNNSGQSAMSTSPPFQKSYPSGQGTPASSRHPRSQISASEGRPNAGEGYVKYGRRSLPVTKPSSVASSSSGSSCSEASRQSARYTGNANAAQTNRVGYHKGVKRQLDVPSPKLNSSFSGSSGSLDASATKRKYQQAPIVPPLNCKPQVKHEIFAFQTVVNGGVWDKLSTQIWERYVANNQSNQVFERKMRLHEVLYRILHEHFPLCGLYVVGSSMTGFGCNTSDIDMCLMLQHNDIDQKMDAINILIMVLKALKRCDFVQKAELIRAKVPILKFSDSVSGIEVDLNINNSVGIRNTHLLNNYSKLDWRVRPLVIIVKAWARVHDINDAKNMTISSYSLALMVIHYLQCGAVPPVLPCLQKLFPQKFNHESNVHDLVLDEELTLAPMCNNNTLGELFFGFIKYYATHFNFEEHAISVRLGDKVPKSVVMYQRAPKNNPGQWKCLCVEEPFDLTNTARSVYDDYIFARVKQVFIVSYGRLEQSKVLSSILTHPFPTIK